MADSTEGYTYIQYLGLLAPAMIALIAVLVINSFIIVANVNDWFKGRSVTPVDHIVTSLGVSRLCAQFAITLRLYLLTFFQSYPYSYVILITMNSVYPFFTFANIWLTSLLSIVLCLKISTFHTRLFLYLRRMIEHRTAYCIVALVLPSTFGFLFPLLTDISEVTKDGTYNTTMNKMLLSCTDINSIYSYFIGIFIPLVFYCIASSLLFSSLYHHIIKMKMNSNLSINLETYYSLLTFLYFTFLYSTIFFAIHFVSICYYYFYCVRLVWIHTPVGFLTALHSSYLIYRTAKLRSQMSKVLQNVIDFLFPRKEPETRENSSNSTMREISGDRKQ